MKNNKLKEGYSLIYRCNNCGYPSKYDVLECGLCFSKDKTRFITNDNTGRIVKNFDKYIDKQHEY